jgi:hypothetical protein
MTDGRTYYKILTACFGSKMHNKARSVGGLSSSPWTDGQPRRVHSLVDVVVVVDGGLVMGEDA